MANETTLEKLMAQAAAATRQADIIKRLQTVLELGFTVEELREAIILYDRASGALVPSVAKPLLKSSDLRPDRPRTQTGRAAAAQRERTCIYCGDTFLAQKSNAFICPKRECRHKREKILREQQRIAAEAVDAALKDGSLQATLETPENTERTRERAITLMTKARDKGRILRAGDAIRAARV